MSVTWWRSATQECQCGYGLLNLIFSVWRGEGIVDWVVMVIAGIGGKDGCWLELTIMPQRCRKFYIFKIADD